MRSIAYFIAVIDTFTAVNIARTVKLFQGLFEQVQKRAITCTRCHNYKISTGCANKPAADTLSKFLSVNNLQMVNKNVPF